MRTCTLLIALVIFPGCTSVALKRATVAHAVSSTDLRYREVMENLAMIADNPSALPAYSSIYAGTTDVNDIVKATSTSVWSRMALQHPLRYVSFFSTETADFMGSRAVKSNWTLDPTIVPEKLRAMRAACNWVLRGVEFAGPDRQLLERYREMEFADQRMTPVTAGYRYIKGPRPPQNDPNLEASTINTYAFTIKSEYYLGTGEKKVEEATALSFRVVDQNKNIVLDTDEVHLGLSSELLKSFKDSIIKKENHFPSESVSLIHDALQITANDYQKRMIDLLCDRHPIARVPEIYASCPGYYFDVACDLERIGTGWVHMEDKYRDVPHDAAYRTCCGDKYLWVSSQDMGKLSDFLLVLQKIARTDFGSAYYPRPQTRMVQKNFDFTIENNKFHATATVYVDENGLLTPGAGQPAIPRKVRTDNVGVNADLKSVINASAKSASP